MCTHRALLFRLFPFLLCTGPAAAQELIYELGVVWASSGDDFGRAVSEAGHFDTDAWPDLLVGVPGGDWGGAESGEVHVFSGKFGVHTWLLEGEAPGDRFGWSVDNIGDIDGDGRSEVIASAPLHDFPGGEINGGKVYVIRGTGQVMATFMVNQANAQLGSVVRGLGDIDGDGIGDFAFGSPYRDHLGQTDVGSVSVYSGAGITHLFTRYGSEPGEKLGSSVDVLRTGSQATSRIIVGSPGFDGAGVDRGLVQLFDGYGNVAQMLAGYTNASGFGLSVAGVGDVNGDGWRDYAVAAPDADVLFVGSGAGAVFVYSGTSTQQLYSLTGPHAYAWLGQSLAGAGDVNSDGYDDFLIGSPNLDVGGITDAGEARLVSGIDGSTLASYTGGSGDHMGRSVSSAGDLNLDGVPDLIIGANDAPYGEGRAYVYMGGVEPPTIYCTAKVNSQGCTPKISYQGVPSTTISQGFEVSARDVINNQAGILLWGREANNAPFFGGTLCVKPPIVRSHVMYSHGNAGGPDCSGEYHFQFAPWYMTGQGIAPGDRIHVQFWCRDPAASHGVGLTDALSFEAIP